MATVKGVNRTKQDNPGGANVIAQGYNKAKLGVIYDEYEAAALAAASIIQLGDKLPAGAVIVDILIATDDLAGSTATLDIGDSHDADRYATALDVHTTAGGNRYSLMNDGNIDGIGYKIGTNTGDDQLQAVVNTNAITGTIKVFIVYAV